MVMDAVAEPYPFGINHKIPETVAFAIAGVVLHNILEGAPDGQVVFVVLIKQNVAAGNGCLAEIINQFFLFGRKFIKSGNLVTHDFQVGELLQQKPEILLRGLLFGALDTGRKNKAHGNGG
ncbi:hypothetical protein DSECCO2_566610 [anaerobic digester metagenome]